jgi:hypothetical protein
MDDGSVMTSAGCQVVDWLIRELLRPEKAGRGVDRGTRWAAVACAGLRVPPPEEATTGPDQYVMLLLVTVRLVPPPPVVKSELDTVAVQPGTTPGRASVTVMDPSAVLMVDPCAWVPR